MIFEPLSQRRVTFRFASLCAFADAHKRTNQKQGRAPSLTFRLVLDTEAAQTKPAALVGWKRPPVAGLEISAIDKKLNVVNV